MRIGVEPLNRFETYFINRADQAVAMAEDVGGDCGVALDIFHMDIEEADWRQAIRDTGSHLVGALGERTVGVTMLGQTTPGVMRLRERLLDAGHAPVVFHANGVDGPAMEKLAATGALAGVVDHTLSELANSLLDSVHATGPDRLRVAGRHGLAQVVVPGCCDFFNQGARDTVSARFRDRKSYFHNP